MKCPVCDWEQPALLCPRCDFDSSRDYAKFPTFGTVGKVPSSSALRKEWEEKQRAQDPRIKMPPVEVASTPEEPRKDTPQSESVEPAAPGPKGSKPRKFKWFALAIILLIGVISWHFISKAIFSYAKLKYYQEYPSLYAVLKADDYGSEYVYGTDVLKESVRTVTFLNTLENEPRDAIDVSFFEDGSVKLWYVKEGAFYDLFYAANGGINGWYACSYMFANHYSNLKSVSFNESFYLLNAKSLSGMFMGCTSLENLDLSSLDTSSIEDMSSMFFGCESLKKLDLINFNTANVKNMNQMFANCVGLSELNLSSFDTSNVTDTDAMFYNCPAGADWQHLLK